MIKKGDKNMSNGETAQETPEAPAPKPKRVRKLQPKNDQAARTAARRSSPKVAGGPSKAIRDVANLLRLAADPTRLTVLLILDEELRTVGAIVEAMPGITQP